MRERLQDDGNGGLPESHFYGNLWLIWHFGFGHLYPATQFGPDWGSHPLPRRSPSREITPPIIEHGCARQRGHDGDTEYRIQIYSIHSDGEAHEDDLGVYRVL